MKGMGILLLALLLCPGLAAANPAAGSAAPKAASLVADGQAIDLESERYRELFKELEGKDFAAEELRRLFAGVTINKRVLELMDTQWEALPYYKYYPRFITDEVIQEGKRKLQEHAELLAAVEKKFGVEREIVVAIWAIESRFGNHKGAFNLFRTLNTMFDAYPRRRAFYRQELIAFLLLCRENQVDPLSITGSYGGAFGQTQFIPSSFRDYAVDFEGKGKRDVWNSIPDVLASIANYLHRFNWTLAAPVYVELGRELRAPELRQAFEKGRQGLISRVRVNQLQGVELPPSPEGRDLTIVGLELADGAMRYVAGYPNLQAITKWNNSNRYAMAVSELAAKFK